MDNRIEDTILDQSIRELLYSFRKNGGDLDYCVKSLREDFNKAGYTRPEPTEDMVEAAVNVYKPKNCKTCRYHAWNYDKLHCIFPNEGRYLIAYERGKPKDCPAIRKAKALLTPELKVLIRLDVLDIVAIRKDTEMPYPNELSIAIFADEVALKVAQAQRDYDQRQIKR